MMLIASNFWVNEHAGIHSIDYITLAAYTKDIIVVFCTVITYHSSIGSLVSALRT